MRTLQNLFSGATEMHGRFVETDWSKTPLGPVAQWPANLKTTAALMLNSQIPIFMTWGKERTFLYNDAYISILGQKHPHAFARPFEDAWKDVWNYIVPLIRSADAGQPVFLEDVPFSSDRNGRDEVFYATFSYTPIKNEAAEVEGLFCTVVETTAKRNALEAVRESERVLDQIFLESHAFMTMLSVPDYRYLRTNAKHIELIRKKDILGKTVAEVEPELEAQGVIQLLDNVVSSGQPYVAQEMLVRYAATEEHPARDRYLDLVYQPLKAPDGTVYAVSCQGYDVTERVLNLKALEVAKDTVAASREQLALVMNSVPALISYMDLHRRYTFVNSEYEKWFKISASDLIGKRVEDFLGAEVYQRLSPYMDRAYKGEALTYEQEAPYASGTRHIQVTYAPDRDLKTGAVRGIIALIHDVTEKRNAQLKFERNVDGSPAILWITEKDGSCTYLSKQWYEYTGQTEEEALGFGWLEATHPDDKLPTAKIYTEANDRQEPFYAEYRLRTKDGRYRWAIDAGNPRFDENGNYLGYAGTVFDIHERVSAEHELRDLQNRFQQSAEATDLGVWYCDLPFDELIWNKEVKNHFFLPRDARVTIDTFYECIHPEDREKTRLAISTSIETRKPYDTVYRTVDHANPKNIKFVRAVGWTDYNKEGKPIRFDGITLDITAQTLREEELQLARDEANKANQLKSAFLANMSHEIRTPLAAILGFSGLLKERSIDADEKDRYLDTIIRNGNSLTRIIDDILDLAKVEAGKLEIESIPFSLYAIATDVVDMFKDKARDQGIYLLLNIEENVPAQVASDPTRLRQILVNLIGNAVKFTVEGGIRVNIRATSIDAEKTKIMIDVKDTGIGLTPEQGEKLFKPFTQADNSTTRRFGGTGLGLALSQRLSQALSGKIEITESRLGEGSTFTLTFIANAVQKPTQASSLEGSGKTISAKSLSGVHVLVVDDSADNQFLVERVLTRSGATVATALDGEEAVKKALSDDFDLVLMDIQMPILDGYEAKLALDNEGYQKPVIALTAHAMSEERARTRQAGFAAHLTKPLNGPELVRIVGELVRGKE